MGYIYIVTNTLNGKQYIGQTKNEDINSRWNRHKNLCKNSLGRYIYAAYNKHGIDKFKFQIICICFDEDCDIYENEYINKYNTIAPNGYNLRAGGGNKGKHHPETIILIKNKLKGRICAPPVSEDTKKKISESLKGSKNGNYGKLMTLEQKKKISESLKKNGNKVYNYLSLVNLQKGREAVRRKVTQYTLDGQYIAEYNSTEEASRKTGISGSVIRNVCNPKKINKSAGGFIWKYIS